MKKAFAAIVLLASSAGVFALPAAARDRDDHYVNRNSGYTRVYRNDVQRGRDNDRNWHEARRVDVRDYRGGSRFAVGFNSYGPNCR